MKNATDSTKVTDTAVVLNSTIDEDTTDIIITIGQYRLMSKCPILLEDCEKNRQVDSLELGFKTEQNISLNNQLYIQKEKTKKANRRTLTGTLFGVVVGVLATLKVM